MELMPAPAENAGHLAAQQRQHFVELVSGHDARVNHDFDIGIYLARFFEEAEGKARADAECVLAINAAAWKYELHFLARGAQARDVGEIDWAREPLSRVCFRFARHAQRKRRPGLFLVSQLELGEHGL